MLEGLYAKRANTQTNFCEPFELCRLNKIFDSKPLLCEILKIYHKRASIECNFVKYYLPLDWIWISIILKAFPRKFSDNISSRRKLFLKISTLYAKAHKTLHDERSSKTVMRYNKSTIHCLVINSINPPLLPDLRLKVNRKSNVGLKSGLMKIDLSRGMNKRAFYDCTFSLPCTRGLWGMFSSTSICLLYSLYYSLLRWLEESVINLWKGRI